VAGSSRAVEILAEFLLLSLETLFFDDFFDAETDLVMLNCPGTRLLKSRPCQS